MRQCSNMDGNSHSKRSHSAKARLGHTNLSRSGLIKQSKLKFTIRCPKSIKKFKFTFQHFDNGHDGREVRCDSGERIERPSTTHEDPFDDIHEYSVSEKVKTEACAAPHAQYPTGSRCPSVDRRHTASHPCRHAPGAPGSMEKMYGLHQTLAIPQRLSWPPAYDTNVVEMDSDSQDNQEPRETPGEELASFEDEQLFG